MSDNHIIAQQELKEPNAETRDALEEYEIMQRDQRNYKRYVSFDEMMKELFLKE